MKTPAHTAAASAVRSLRVQALLSEVPKTQIAKNVGVNRMTVAKHLKSDDMSLNMFIRTAQAIKADPVKILAEAIESIQKQEEASDTADASE